MRAIDADELMRAVKVPVVGDGDYYTGIDDERARCIELINEAETIESETVVEWCPECGNEIEMRWDVEMFGYKAYCPVCGSRLMLCDECLHGEGGGSCDYDNQTDTCKFNQREEPEA